MTIQANTQPVIDALNHLQQRLTPAGMHAVFNQIGETLQNNIQANLGVGKTPYDAPFDPLKKPRKRQGSRIAGDIPLNDTRTHIYSRITFNADGNGVDVGMLNDEDNIGQVHQFGSSKKNIPARPFMPIVNNQVVLPPEWEREVFSAMLRAINDVTP
jgi:phage virion morphogenesis protein